MFILARGVRRADLAANDRDTRDHLFQYPPSTVSTRGGALRLPQAKGVARSAKALAEFVAPCELRERERADEQPFCLRAPK